MSQPTWAAIEVAIQRAIAAASGLTTIWSHQNANAPAGNYIRIALGSAITIGVDFVAESDVPDWAASTDYDVGDRVINDSGKTYRCTVAGTSAGSGGPTGTGAAIVDGGVTWAFVAIGGEISQTLGGLREVPLVIEGFTASTVETASAASAISVVDDIVSKLRMPTARAALRAVGVTPFGPGATNYIPELVSTGFRGRAIAEVRCYMPARAIVEYTSYITSISAGITIEGAPGSPLSETIDAP